MLIGLSVLLAIGALLLVAYPILTSEHAGHESQTSRSQETLQELLAQRDAAFQALRDLQFDRQVGKTSEEDFLVFEASLKRAAADALRRLDEWELQADRTLIDGIEAEVAARRARRSGSDRLCPSCGRPVAAADQFCTGCGARMVTPAAAAAAQLSCPTCGRAHEAGDAFCAGCGRPLGGQHVTDGQVAQPRRLAR